MTVLMGLAPAARLGGRRAGLLIERNVLVYRRTWMILVSGFFEPLFYLLSIGLGLGALIGAVPFGGQEVPYAVFVAPALMASSAMNGAIYDSTMNVFYKLREARTYDAILATPIGVSDVALGEIGWALIRGAIYATMFLLVMFVLGIRAEPARDPGPAGGDPDRLRVCRGWDGGNHLPADVAGHGHGPAGDPAAVPVLGDVLSPRHVPRRRAPPRPADTPLITAST